MIEFWNLPHFYVNIGSLSGWILWFPVDKNCQYLSTFLQLSVGIKTMRNVSQFAYFSSNNFAYFSLNNKQQINLYSNLRKVYSNFETCMLLSWNTSFSFLLSTTSNTLWIHFQGEKKSFWYRIKNNCISCNKMWSFQTDWD